MKFRLFTVALAAVASVVVTLMAISFSRQQKVLEPEQVAISWSRQQRLMAISFSRQQKVTCSDARCQADNRLGPVNAA
jgi:isopentenyl diphosphate isomerase/L-lactate dehydrogenase-like FMN-dependent dehydrogenase